MAEAITRLSTILMERSVWQTDCDLRDVLKGFKNDRSSPWRDVLVCDYSCELNGEITRNKIVDALLFVRRETRWRGMFIAVVSPQTLTTISGLKPFKYYFKQHVVIDFPHILTGIAAALDGASFFSEIGLSLLLDTTECNVAVQEIWRLYQSLLSGLLGESAVSVAAKGICDLLLGLGDEWWVVIEHQHVSALKQFRKELSVQGRLLDKDQFIRMLESVIITLRTKGVIPHEA